jgi:mono/diheme cytochrome c family protein
MSPRHPEEPRSRLCHPEELRSRRATRDPQRGLWSAALLLVVVTVTGCRAAPAPGKDAVQEAFKDDALSARAARGHRVFLQRCATCHGPQGRGDGQNAYNLQPPPPDFQESLAKLSVGDRRKVIEGGTAALGRSPLCPAWGRSLAPEDVDAVMAWLEAAARPAAEPEPNGQVGRSAR